MLWLGLAGSLLLGFGLDRLDAPAPLFAASLLPALVALLLLGRRLRQALLSSKTALQESRCMWQSLLDASLDAVICIDEKGRVTEFSRHAEELFGYSRAEAINHPLGELIIPPELREAHEQGLRRFLAGGAPRVIGKRVELEAMRRDGTRFPVELTISFWSVGGHKLFIAYLRDISSRRAIARELELAREQAELASRSKSEFLAVMSHEIRTPLSALLGSLGLVEVARSPGEQRHLLENARQAGEALLALVNDTLDLSKIEAGRLDLNIQPLEIAPLAEECISLLAPRAAAKGLRLGLFLDPALPRHLLGDAGRIRQVLLNLLGNAEKFTKQGDVTLELHWLENTTLRCEIRDTGVGINTELKAQLFNQYVQGRREDHPGGSGLGLAICRHLVELMQGRIGVESDPGHGSCFWFELALPAVDEQRLSPPDALPDRLHVWLPSSPLGNCLRQQLQAWGIEPIEEPTVETPPGLARAGEPAHPLPQPLLPSALLHLLGHGASKPAPVDASGRGITAHPGARILVAEDSRANQMVATYLLEHAGYRVSLVSNGSEALEALAEETFDLVLMDLAMPKLDGAEATRRFRANEPEGQHLPIIAFTANAMRHDLDRCLAAGMDDVLFKPVDRRQLLTKVARWLDSSHPLARLAHAVEEGPPPAATQRLLDDDTLAQLRADIGDAMPRMVSMFLAEARQRVDALRDASAKRDLDGLDQQSHALKSSAGSLGARALMDAAAALEECCKRQDLDGALERLEKVLALAEPSFVALQQRLGEPSDA